MPLKVDGIIDEIDRLVDHSLAQPIVDDYDADRYDRCPHCNRHFHGLPLTKRVAEMYEARRFDESYRVNEDDSQIICPGSDFIGPMPSTMSELQKPYAFRWSGRVNGVATVYTDQIIGIRVGAQRWWRTTLPSHAEVEQRSDTDWANDRITVEIGDAAHTFNAENVRFDVQHDEVMTLQSRCPVMTNTRITMDVLSDYVPRVGGTWVPLTAPGVTRHPDDAGSLRYNPPGVVRGVVESIAIAPEGGVTSLDCLLRDGWVRLGALRDDGPGDVDGRWI